MCSWEVKKIHLLQYIYQILSSVITYICSDSFITNKKKHEM